MASSPTVPPVLDRRLADFDRSGYDKGRSVLGQAAWFAVCHLIFVKWWLPPALRPPILRLFGGKIGSGVLIRHGVVVQWPWKVAIGDDCWIGERAWFINLECITLEDNVCVSQGAVLCTGSHVHDDPRFRYDNAAITLGSGTWVGLGATVLRGVNLAPHSLVPAGAVARRSTATP